MAIHWKTCKACHEHDLTVAHRSEFSLQLCVSCFEDRKRDAQPTPEVAIDFSFVRLSPAAARALAIA
jgi:hypothetical protein